MRKPAVGRGVELPEFADLRALPAAHRGEDLFGRDGMGEIVFQRPTADLSPVEFEGMQAERFGSGEAVRTRWGAGQTFLEQVPDSNSHFGCGGNGRTGGGSPDGSRG